MLATSCKTTWHNILEDRSFQTVYLKKRGSKEISRFQCTQNFQLYFYVMFRLFLHVFLFCLRNKEVRQSYKLEK